MSIPRIIFSIWIGDIPPLIARCVDSQRKCAEDFGYEYKLYTLDNCFKGTKYIKECLTSPQRDGIRHCKASDYLRLHYLWLHGGVYIDGDVEILPNKSFDELLNNRMFVGDEGIATIPNSRLLGTAVIGAEPNHPFISQWQDKVEEEFSGYDADSYYCSMDLLNVMSYSFWDKLTIYSPDYFYSVQYGIRTENSICIHHSTKSWVEGVNEGVSKGVNLPTVSILIPHIAGTRQEGLDKCLKSISALDYPRELIDTHVIEGDDTVPQKVDRGYKETKGEYILFLADDTEIMPDALQIAICDSRIQNKGHVAFNTGSLLPDRGNANEHFIIRRDLVSKLEGGLIFSKSMTHTGTDNWMMAQTEKLGEFLRSEDAIILHHHFSKGGEFDTVYQKGWEHVEQDREILKRKLAEL